MLHMAAVRVFVVSGGRQEGPSRTEPELPHVEPCRRAKTVVRLRPTRGEKIQRTILSRNCFGDWPVACLKETQKLFALW